MTDLIIPLGEQIHREFKKDAVEVAVLSDKRRAKSWAEWDYWVLSGHEPCWVVNFYG